MAVQRRSITEKVHTAKKISKSQVKSISKRALHNYSNGRTLRATK